jgi:hypothetical protein
MDILKVESEQVFLTRENFLKKARAAPELEFEPAVNEAATRAGGCFALAWAGVDQLAFDAKESGANAPAVAQNGFPPFVEKPEAEHSRYSHGEEERGERFEFNEDGHWHGKKQRRYETSK